MLFIHVRYCGSVGPRIVSSSNKLVVRFTSDEYVALKGFQATYKFVEDEISETSFTFSVTSLFLWLDSSQSVRILRVLLHYYYF